MTPLQVLQLVQDAKDLESLQNIYRAYPEHQDQLKQQFTQRRIQNHNHGVASPDNDGFIEANTKTIDLPILQEQTIILAFAKDYESTISNFEFVENIYDAIQHVCPTEGILEPSVKVSHPNPIKVRVPEAKEKPAKELLDHEKTLYYERMAFMIELPSIRGIVGEDTLSLTVGGVRAYNLENLYSIKSPERFKLFIGFKIGCAPTYASLPMAF